MEKTTITATNGVTVTITTYPNGITMKKCGNVSEWYYHGAKKWHYKEVVNMGTGKFDMDEQPSDVTFEKD